MEKKLKEKINTYIEMAKLLKMKKIDIQLEMDEWEYIRNLEKEKEMYKKAFEEMTKNYFKLQEGLNKIAEHLFDD